VCLQNRDLFCKVSLSILWMAFACLVLFPCMQYLHDKLWSKLDKYEHRLLMKLSSLSQLTVYIKMRPIIEVEVIASYRSGSLAHIFRRSAYSESTGRRYSTVHVVHFRNSEMTWIKDQPMHPDTHVLAYHFTPTCFGVSEAPSSGSSIWACWIVAQCHES
jgi:hypothetical protein